MSYDVTKYNDERVYVEVFEIDLDINDPEFDDLFAATGVSYGTPRTTSKVNGNEPYKPNTFRTYRYTNCQLETNDTYFPGLDTKKTQYFSGEIKPGDKVSASASATVYVKDFEDNLVYSLPPPYDGMRPPRGAPVSHFQALLSRNHVVNRPARLKRGFVPVGRDITDDDFQIEHFVIKSVAPADNNGKIKFELIDELFFASEGKAKVPIICNALLNTEIPESGTLNINFVAKTFGYKPIHQPQLPQVGDRFYGVIGEEIFDLEVQSFNVGSLSGVLTMHARGLFNTTIEEHSIEDSIQGCVYVNQMNVLNVIRMLLKDYTNINHDRIPTTEWDTLATNEFSNHTLTRVIVKPEEVRKYLDELVRETGMWLFFNVLTNQLEAGLITRFDKPVINLTENEHILSKTLKFTNNPGKQVTRATIHYAKFNPTEGDDVLKYRKHFQDLDDKTESDGNLRAVREQKPIKANWYGSGSLDTINAQRVVQLAVERFKEEPYTFKLELDPKYIGKQSEDKVVWYGSVISLTTPRITDQHLQPLPKLAQIIKMKPNANKLGAWQVEALSYTGEVEPDADLVIPAGEHLNLNFREMLDNGLGTNPTIDMTEVRTYTVVVSNGAIIGSRTVGIPACRTGILPNGARWKLINLGRMIGTGGTGGDAGYNSQDAGSHSPTYGGIGGDALILDHATDIDNLSGLIACGGSGGNGGGLQTGAIYGSGSAGGGGAGFKGGRPGMDDPDGPTSGKPAEYGTLDFGGAPSERYTYGGRSGTKGKDLGDSDAFAIKSQGNLFTITNGNNTNQIRGKVL